MPSRRRFLPWALLVIVAGLGLWLVIWFRPGAAVVPFDPPPRPVRHPLPALADCYGDLMPPGALCRLGTVRLQHDASVTAVVFSPDGKTLASTSEDDTIRFWDIETGKEIRRFAGGEQAFREMHPHLLKDSMEAAYWRHGSLAYSPNGLLLAFGGDRIARLLEVATGKELHRFPGQRGTSVTFSPDGSLLAAPSDKRTICFWDTATGAKAANITLDQKVGSISFSPCGKLVAVAGLGDAVEIWDVAAAKQIRRLAEKKNEGKAAAFSPDGTTVAVAKSREGAGLWDVATGKLVRELVVSIVRHGWVSSIIGRGGDPLPAPSTVVFSPDGRKLITSSSQCDSGADWTMRIWDVATGKEIPGLSGSTSWIMAAAFSPDGKLLATAHDRVIRLWDVRTGREVRPRPVHEWSICDSAFSSDGKQVISAGSDHFIRIWDSRTGQPIDGFEVDSARLGPLNRLMRLTDGRLAVIGYNGISLVDLNKRQEVLLQDVFIPLAMAPDGMVIYSPKWPKVIRLRHGNLGEAIVQLPGYRRTCALTADGTVLALQGADEEDYGANLTRRENKGLGDTRVHLWDLRTRTHLFALDHLEEVACMCFSPNAQILALASGSAVHIWDVAKKQRLTCITGSQGDVKAVLISPDGRTLAAEDAKGVRFCHIATGTEIHRFPEACFGACFSADGRRFASATDNPTGIVWDVSFLFRDNND